MDWIGKDIILFFQDVEKVLRKFGKVVGYDAVFITLENHDGIQIIPLSRVLRMEVQKHG